MGEEGVGWEERGYGRAEDALNGLGGGGWIRGSDPLDSSPRSSFIFRAGWRWKRQKRKMSVICSRKTSERLRGPLHLSPGMMRQMRHHTTTDWKGWMAWHGIPCRRWNSGRVNIGRRKPFSFLLLWLEAQKKRASEPSAMELFWSGSGFPQGWWVTWLLGCSPSLWSMYGIYGRKGWNIGGMKGVSSFKP